MSIRPNLWLCCQMSTALLCLAVLLIALVLIDPDE